MLLQNLRRHIQNLSDREKQLFVSLVMLLFLGLLIGCGWLLYNQTEETLAKQKQLQRALAELEKKKTSYAQTLANLQEIERRTHLPPISMGTLIDETAKKNDISVPTQRPLPAVSIDKKYLLQSAEILVPSIAWDKLLTFLQDLESTPDRLIRITDLSLRGLGDNKSEVAATIVVSVYELDTSTQKDPGKKPAEKTKDTP